MPKTKKRIHYQQIMADVIRDVYNRQVEIRMEHPETSTPENPMPELIPEDTMDLPALWKRAGLTICSATPIDPRMCLAVAQYVMIAHIQPIAKVNPLLAKGKSVTVGSSTYALLWISTLKQLTNNISQSAGILVNKYIQLQKGTVKPPQGMSVLMR